MTKYGVGNKYGLDLEGLWEMFAADPDEEGEIDIEEGGYIKYEKVCGNKYYDLYTSEGLACCDGELCEILEETKDYIELVEEDQQIRFRLSRREFEIACMC